MHVLVLVHAVFLREVVEVVDLLLLACKEILDGDLRGSTEFLELHSVPLSGPNFLESVNIRILSIFRLDLFPRLLPLEEAFLGSAGEPILGKELIPLPNSPVWSLEHVSVGGLQKLSHSTYRNRINGDCLEVRLDVLGSALRALARVEEGLFLLDLVSSTSDFPYWTSVVLSLSSNETL